MTPTNLDNAPTAYPVRDDPRTRWACRNCGAMDYHEKDCPIRIRIERWHEDNDT